MSGPGRLASIITAADPAVRDRSLDELCRGAPAEHLLAEGADLERFRRRSDNLYERVRALFFLYAIHRFHLPARLAPPARAPAPRADPLRRLHPPPAAALRGGDRRLPGRAGPQGPTRRALQRPGRRLPRAGLPDAGRPGPAQRPRGAGQPVDVPHRPPRWTSRCASARSCCAPRRTGLFPVLREGTPVRMDLSHSGWSDIFFLGMDYPEGARVLNVSIDLGVRGRDAGAPPAADRGVPARDRRAGAAAGQRRPGRRGGRHQPGRGLRLRPRLPRPAQGGGDRRRARAARAGRLRRAPGRAAGAPGRARAWGSRSSASVNDIPKGSRLAVSTNLLAA